MRIRTTLAATATAAATAAVFAPAAHAELIYGLLNNDSTSGQRLVTIDSNTRAVTSTVLLGTTGAGTLSSIDTRPATGELFGFASATNQLYSVNPTTGTLTAVGATPTAGNVSSGTIDFNPTVDRIRLVGTQSGNQNFRLVPTTGAIAAADTALAYAATDSGAGLTPNIANVAYTNNLPNATTTTLYDIDITRDVLTTQNPPNNGTLNTVGGLGFDAGAAGSFGNAFTGFDVSGVSGTAFLSSSPIGTPPALGGPSATTATLYTVNLATGAATPAGLITGLPFGRSVQDIAVVAIPEPTTAALATAAGAALLAARRRRSAR